MPTLYDLVLVLDPASEEDRRAQIRSELEATINARGSVEHQQEWGQRPLAYEIDHKSEGEYHLLQFTGPPELVDQLSRTLRIADGVVRHRIIRVRPGTPPPPGPPPLRSEREERPERGERGDRGDRDGYRGDRDRGERRAPSAV